MVCLLNTDNLFIFCELNINWHLWVLICITFATSDIYFGLKLCFEIYLCFYGANSWGINHVKVSKPHKKIIQLTSNKHIPPYEWQLILFVIIIIAILLCSVLHRSRKRTSIFQKCHKYKIIYKSATHPRPRHIETWNNLTKYSGLDAHGSQNKSLKRKLLLKLQHISDTLGHTQWQVLTDCRQHHVFTHRDNNY